MELLNYIRPEGRFSKLRAAYNRLKSKIPKGSAQQEIENDLKKLEKIPKSLVASSSEFAGIFDRLKLSLFV